MNVNELKSGQRVVAQCRIKAEVFVDGSPYLVSHEMVIHEGLAFTYCSSAPMNSNRQVQAIPTTQTNIRTSAFGVCSYPKKNGAN
jgi:hypothetical protein